MSPHSPGPGGASIYRRVPLTAGSATHKTPKLEGHVSAPDSAGIPESECFAIRSIVSPHLGRGAGAHRRPDRCRRGRNPGRGRRPPPLRQLLIAGQARRAVPVGERLGRLQRPGPDLPPRPARPAADRVARGVADAPVQSGDGRQVPGHDPGRGHCRRCRCPRAPRQGAGRVRRLAAALDLLHDGPRHQLGRRRRGRPQGHPRRPRLVEAA
jgi:hypothetical protein